MTGSPETILVGPDFEMQAAIVTALQASSALQMSFGSRAPQEWLVQGGEVKVEFPYITIGEGQNVPDVADCIDGSEVYLTLHIWSRAESWKECKQIVAMIWAALQNSTLTLTENTCLELARESANFTRDPDGKTKHAVLTLKALTEPA